MNIEFDVYKQKLNDCRPALEGLAASLNLEGLKNELERLHAMQEAPGFWDDPDKSQKIVVKTKQTETKQKALDTAVVKLKKMQGHLLKFKTENGIESVKKNAATEEIISEKDDKN